VGNTGYTAEYTYHDYSGAIDAITTGEVGDRIDMVGALTENETVQVDINIALADLADSHRFAVAFFPAEVSIADKSTYGDEIAFDDSRVQLIYPGRDEGEHIIGAYVGLRSRLGIRTTPIRKKLRTHPTVNERLTKGDRVSLIDNFVVPIQDDPTGVMVMDDINTVDVEENETERNLRFAYSRLVADYIIRTIKINEDDFIGRLNRPVVRKAMKTSIKGQLIELQNASQLLSFQINVQAESATRASVEVNLDLADPLRHVENTITVGE